MQNKKKGKLEVKKEDRKDGKKKTGAPKKVAPKQSKE